MHSAARHVHTRLLLLFLARMERNTCPQLSARDLDQGCVLIELGPGALSSGRLVALWPTGHLASPSPPQSCPSGFASIIMTSLASGSYPPPSGFCGLCVLSPSGRSDGLVRHGVGLQHVEWINCMDT